MIDGQRTDVRYTNGSNSNSVRESFDSHKNAKLQEVVKSGLLKQGVWWDRMRSGQRVLPPVCSLPCSMPLLLPR